MASANSMESYRAAVDQIRLDVTEAMALCAVLELGSFTTLSERPMTAEELSATIEVKPRRLKMLLYQLVISEYLELHEDQLCNAPIWEELFIQGRPEYYGGIHGLWSEMLSAMLETASSIITEEPKTKIDLEGMSQDELGTFLKGHSWNG